MNKNKKNNEDYWMYRAPMELKNTFDEIARKRVQLNKDKRTVSYRRLGLAITRHEQLLKDLTIADLLPNRKKAQATQFSIFQWMVLAFVSVLFFAGLIYTMGLINDVFIDVGLKYDAGGHPNYSFPCINNISQTCTGTFYANLTQASNSIFGQLNTGIQGLRLVALMYILGYAVIIIITNALMRVHPIWFFAYILISLLGIIFAPQISNAYETLLGSGIFGGELVNMGTVNTIMLNLPVICLIISVLGGILLFINLLRGGYDRNTLE